MIAISAIAVLIGIILFLIAFLIDTQGYKRTTLGSCIYYLGMIIGCAGAFNLGLQLF